MSAHPTQKLLGVFLLACIALSGCATQEDLMAQRTRFDTTAALCVQARSETVDRNNLYLKMIPNTSQSASSPYSDLLSYIGAMQDQVVVMSTLQQQIIKLERKLETFSADKKVVSRKDTKNWDQFQEFLKEFKPLKEKMENAKIAFNAISSNFDILVLQNHIGQTTVEALIKETTNFLSKLDLSVTEMGQQEANDQRNLSGLESGGVSAIITDQKQGLLTKMDSLLAPLRNFQQSVRQDLENISENLPPSGPIWTGPGMNQSSDACQDIWTSEATYAQNFQDFENLNERFQQVSGAPAETPLNP